MLIGNRRLIYKSNATLMGGAICNDTGSLNGSRLHCRFVSAGGYSKMSSVPFATEGGTAWLMSIVGGNMLATYSLEGLGAIGYANLAAGRNMTVAMDGSGGFTTPPEGSLIMYAIAALMGNGEIQNNSEATGKLALAAALVGGCTITAEMIAAQTAEALANLSGSSSMTGALNLLAGAVADIIGSGSVTGTPKGIASMSADITPFTELSPEGLATAVWNSVASQFNIAGSMGNKLNSASAAGDPWTAELPGLYASGSAGKFLSEARDASILVRKLQKNKAVVSSDGLTVVIYDDDGVTPLQTFDITSDQKTRTPQ